MAKPLQGPSLDKFPPKKPESLPFAFGSLIPGYEDSGSEDEKDSKNNEESEESSSGEEDDGLAEPISSFENTVDRPGVLMSMKGRGVLPPTKTKLNSNFSQNRIKTHDFHVNFIQNRILLPKISC